MSSAKTPEDLEHQLSSYETADPTLGTMLRLHKDDRDSFYQLFTLTPHEHTPAWLTELQSIAKQLHRMSRRYLTIRQEPDAGYVVLQAGKEELRCESQELD